MARSYIIPFVAYLLATTLAARFADAYALAYLVVVLLVGSVTWFLLRRRDVVRPHRDVGAAVVVGLVGIAAWIGLSALHLEARLAEWLPGWLQPKARVGFDPFEELTSWWMVWGFIGARLVGLALLVPVVEELFWRGFLMRWLISPDWETVEAGSSSTKAFLVVTLLFTLAHPEWLAAAVYCALLNGLWIWKKDLWSCIVAHAVSNLVLGVYVPATGAWWLW